MSPGVAYIAGVLSGDGYLRLHKTRTSISPELHLTVKDEAFAQAFFDALASLGLKPRIKKYKYWTVYTSCKRTFFDYLKSLTPPRLQEELASERLVIEYLRGFYESEGHCYRMKNQRGIRVFVDNMIKEKLELFAHLLKRVYFDASIHIEHNGQGVAYHRLEVLGNKRQKRQFFLTVNPVIKKWKGGGE